MAPPPTIGELLKDKPHIPLELFVKLAYSLSPDEIAKLPPQKLPENIPLDIVDQAPIYSRRALEDLILAANSFHLQRRLELQDTYGDEVVAALDRAKQTKSAATIRVFKNKLADLATLTEQYKKTKDRGHLDLLTNNIKHINSLLMDVRAENATISRSAQLLSAIDPITPNDGAHFRSAITALRTLNEQIEKLLAEYLLLRLVIINREMQEKNRQVNQLEEDYMTLQREIDVLREDLERSQTLWKRAIQRGKANQEGDDLQKRISGLVTEQKSKEIAISENDLTLWLDTIVDVSLHPFTREKSRKVVSDARVALYNLLNKYCMSQEGGAKQIARNPFLQIDAKQAIRFMLMSEQFILDYFSKKRNENTAWISDVAQVKMEDLDGLEKDLLDELKKSSKFLKKNA